MEDGHSRDSGEVRHGLPRHGDLRAHLVRYPARRELPIHHVEDERKQTLFAEVSSLLTPGGVFANLEIVKSPTQVLQDQWRDEMGARDDASDRLSKMEPQLQWLRAAGLEDVDCIWKWRALALLRGAKPR